MSYPRDFYFQASSGEIRGLQAVNKFGSNPDVDIASTPETIWSSGGLYTFPASGGSISVVSSSANDTAAGTGARTIVVEGVDENYIEITETFTMNGVAPVISSRNTWFRAYRAYVASAGTGEVNAGETTITLGAITLATIPVDLGQTQMAVFTIPQDKKGYIMSVTGSILRTGTNRSSNIGLYCRGNGVKRLRYEFTVETTGATTFTKHFKSPIVIDEKTDIYLNAVDVSSNNTIVFGSFTVLVQ
ncbi:MAG: hypothetical protein HN613_00195 [Gammaproteobacteria bacterium]|jgi:hypothetical protein|nr:hypothetical protein [Gammaproteobacteria bacterium]